MNISKVHKTDHEANAEADKANCHAILADEALEEEGLYIFALKGLLTRNKSS